MEKGSRMAHGDPRPARTQSRDQQSSFFFRFFYEAILIVCTRYLLFTSMIPVMGNDPRNYQGRGIIAVLLLC